MCLTDKIEKIVSNIQTSHAQCVSLECTDEYISWWTNEFNSWPSMKHLGFNLKFINRFASIICIDNVSSIHRGGLGIDAVNGAILSGMMDGAIATVGFAHYPENICGTSNLSINILRPVFGDHIYSCGYAIKKNRNMAFCEALLYDSDFKVCATATGIVGVSKNSSTMKSLGNQYEL